jgi:HSP20 family protein
MIETMVEKPVKLVPTPFEEFEEWPLRMQEFFDMIARRPFELLETTPRLFGREFEKWFKPELEYYHPVYLKMLETDEALLVRAEVPGFTEKELEITVEPWRLIITGKKEYQEEKKEEKKEYFFKERGFNQIYRSVKLPVAVKAEDVKAVLKNGILELTLPKLQPVKKVHIEVKAA